MHLVVQAVPGGPNITGVRSKAKHLFCSVRYPRIEQTPMTASQFLTNVLQVKESLLNKASF